MLPRHKFHLQHVRWHLPRSCEAWGKQAARLSLWHVWRHFHSDSQSIIRTIDETSYCSFILQINEVVKIQAFIRANKARDDYKTLSKWHPDSGQTLFLLRYEYVSWVILQSLHTHSQCWRSTDGGGEEVRPSAGSQRPGLPGGAGADAPPWGSGHQHPL